jgi:hypothetical protein
MVREDRRITVYHIMSCYCLYLRSVARRSNAVDMGNPACQTLIVLRVVRAHRSIDLFFSVK